MARLYAGIDIGTYHIKVVIAALGDTPESTLRIVGTGSATSKGMRHGYIINSKDAARSIKEAFDRACSMAKVKVKSARVAIGGVGLDELQSTGDVTLTSSAGEVTARDIDRAIREAEKRASSKLTNRKIIHSLPTNYRVDGVEVLGRATGMKGTKLSVDTLLITTLDQHYQDAIDAVEAAGIEVEDVMASPLAASMVTLTKPQKVAGVVLANIGAETVSIAVFENDIPVSVKVLPIGTSAITNDLAINLRLPLHEAEQVKRGAVTGSDIPQKKIDEVISAKLKEIFNLIDAHLKSINRHRLLPAGIVITGGGSGITNVSDLAKATMRLPSQVGNITHSASRAVAADATWAVAYGLCKWGHTTDMQTHDTAGVVSDVWESIVRFFKALLP